MFSNIFLDSFETPGYSFNQNPDFHDLGIKVLQSHLLHLINGMWKGEFFRVFTAGVRKKKLFKEKNVFKEKTVFSFRIRSVI